MPRATLPSPKVARKPLVEGKLRWSSRVELWLFRRSTGVRTRISSLFLWLSEAIAPKKSLRIWYKTTTPREGVTFTPKFESPASSWVPPEVGTTSMGGEISAAPTDFEYFPFDDSRVPEEFRTLEGMAKILLPMPLEEMLEAIRYSHPGYYPNPYKTDRFGWPLREESPPKSEEVPAEPEDKQ